MSVYFIDGNEVNTRIDWAHTPVIGGVTGQRSETFPGDGGRFITKGEPTADGLDVEGFLQANNHAGLYTQINTYAAMRKGRALHTVSFKGVVFNDQHLESLTFGRPRGFTAGAGLRLRIAVRFHWRGVTP